MALASVGPKGEPIATPPICLSSILSKTKDDWIVASLSKSYQPFLLNLLLKSLLENKGLTQFLIVSSKVMLVNNHSISRPATTQHQGQP